MRSSRSALTASSIALFSPSTDLFRAAATSASDFPDWSWVRSSASLSPRYFAAASRPALIGGGGPGGRPGGGPANGGGAPGGGAPGGGGPAPSGGGPPRKS